MDKNITTIDDFISVYPAKTQKILNDIRQTISKIAPDATEKIGYGIPTFSLNGKNLVHFSAYDNHIGFYPGAGAINDFASELKPYETSKGTIRFPIDQPMPLDLIGSIVRYCVKRNLN